MCLKLKLKTFFVSTRYFEWLFLFLFFLVSAMVSLFNVDVDNLVIDHTIQYQNARDKFLDEVNKKVDNTMKIYKEKIEEQYKVLRMYLILMYYYQILM